MAMAAPACGAAFATPRLTQSSPVELKDLLRCSRGKFQLELRCARTIRGALTQDQELSFKLEESNAQSLVSRVERSLLNLAAIDDTRMRIQTILQRASKLPRIAAEERKMENRVMGCTVQVWLTAAIDSEGAVHFAADSDAELTRGFCAVLLQVVNGAQAEQVLELSPDLITLLGVGSGGASSRTNAWHNIIVTMQKRTRLLLAQRQGKPAFDPFPSLLITADDVKPQGDFAIAQAKYLLPDAAKVEALVGYLKSKRIGIVAHFYMDPEVQGVLVAAKKDWPHIHISDSLVMADRAVKMAECGCESIAVLGVDFMSENARAILDKSGFHKVNVYRMSKERIGCSLADAAESIEYFRYLEDARNHSPSLHVIYINTSLQTKARAHTLVPTITCTSSNVVQTVLQAFAQVPDITVWYGPDSYMGANLVELFVRMTSMTDEEIAEVHPMHNKHTIASLLPRLHYFRDGSCIVHDIFGKEVVTRVRQGYGDAFQTAHFEVPGEMFELAMEAKQRGMGTVGSTQNILDFIRDRVEESVQRGIDERLQFVLGTESGMITAIVGMVQNILRSRRESSASNVQVEIVFPVSSDAISTTNGAGAGAGDGDGDGVSKNSVCVVPGVASGEGCSINGGCASCPYMKMNSLNALERVCELVNSEREHVLESQKLGQNKESSRYAEIGCLPIVYMRDFQTSGRFPDELIQHIKIS